MGSVAHVDDGKKKLVNEVRQLAFLRVRLSASKKGGIHVQIRSDSSLVADATKKQDLDPILVELKRLVVKKKVEVF